MEHKLKRVANALTRELKGNEKDPLFWINTAFAVIRRRRRRILKIAVIRQDWLWYSPVSFQIEKV